MLLSVPSCSSLTTTSSKEPVYLSYTSTHSHSPITSTASSSYYTSPSSYLTPHTSAHTSSPLTTSLSPQPSSQSAVSSLHHSPELTPLLSPPATTSQTTPLPSQPRRVEPLVIFTPIVIVLGITILVLTVVFIFSRVKRKQADLEKMQESPPSPPELPPAKQVLVLYSQNSSKYDQECVLENVVKALAEYSVESVYFDNPIVRGTVPTWVAKNVECCDKVLLVCNRQFALEWSRSTANSHGPPSLVYVLRQLIESYVKHDKQVLEKFAILYLRKKDQKCLDNPYLKNMKSYFVDPQNEVHLDQLLRFIIDQQTHILA